MIDLTEITEADRRTYTCGSCHVLAAAIYKETGWPIATFGPVPSYHWFIALPDGRCLDIEGVKTRTEICDRWHTACEVHVYSKSECEDLLRKWSFDYWEFERAEALVPTLLHLVATT